MHKHMPIDHFLIGVPLILVSVLTIVICQLIVKKLIGNERIRQCHEIGGYYLSIVGAFYAVLLGLVVFDALGKYQEAEKTVESEAKSLLAIDILSRQFPKQQNEIKDLISSYIDEVVTVEWDLMERDQKSLKARHLLVTLMHKGLHIEPETENQKAIFPNLATELINAWEARRERTRASNYGIPGAEWIILIAGAIITLLFTFLFTIDSDALHLTMTGLVSLLIAMSLYLVLLFGDPYSGDMKISPEPFTTTQKLTAEF